MAKVQIKNKSLHILIVSPEDIFPCNHGRVVDIYSRLKALIDAGHIVDLLYCDNKTLNYSSLENLSTLGVKKTYVVKQSKSPFGYLYGIPLQSYSRRALSKVNLLDEYDIVILESVYVNYVLTNPSLKTKKIILRVHNDEVKYAAMLSSLAKSIMYKIAFFVEAKLVAKLQSKLFQQASLLWFISYYEYKNCSAATKKYFIPPHLEKLKSVGEHNFIARGKGVLFVGNLFTENNLAGLKWYLDNVHLQIKAEFPDYCLFVAGSCKARDPLFNYKEDSALKVLYNVDDLTTLYQQAVIFINPIFYGAGLKLKTVNAIMNALPVITTRVGIEGTKLEDSPKVYDFTFAKVSDCVELITFLLNKPAKCYTILQEQQKIIREHFIYNITDFLR